MEGSLILLTQITVNQLFNMSENFAILAMMSQSRKLEINLYCLYSCQIDGYLAEISHHELLFVTNKSQNNYLVKKSLIIFRKKEFHFLDLPFLLYMAATSSGSSPFLLTRVLSAPA